MMSGPWRFQVVVVLFAGVCLLAGASCSRREPPAEAGKGSEVRVESFGSLPSGQPVQLFTLTNPNGVEARITDYGGIVVSLKVPDRDGRFDDVVLGFDDLEGYVAAGSYYGAIIGRYGNRIAGGEFILDGETYSLAINNGENHLHGGLRGFDKVVWEAEPFRGGEGQGLVLRYVSDDGEEGYPGTLRVKTTYLLGDDNSLRIDYEATTDKATILNLTNHSYFNLKDGGVTPILGHELTIKASRFTPVGEGLIPTGELRAVEGTPMDFRQPRTIGARIDHDDEQIRLGGGYDHNFVLERGGDELEVLMTVYEATTGRVMEVLTTEPGVQFYTGNFLDGSLTGKNQVALRHRTGFCLETQHFPDSPHHGHFPSTVLEPGDTYRSATVYRFGVRK